MLGVGGVRALRALGLEPTVWHINEGHAAFSVLERLREHTPRRLAVRGRARGDGREHGVHDAHARQRGPRRVSAANASRNTSRRYPAELGITIDEMLDLGSSPEQRDAFNMTRLAIRGAAADERREQDPRRRVVAALRRPNWPDVPPTENPVGYVTNGVHVPTFLRARVGDVARPAPRRPTGATQLMDRDADGPKIRRHPGRGVLVRRIRRSRARCCGSLRERLERQHTRNGLSEAHIHRLLKFVDPDNPNVLTIGFARRFATYKRATLLMTDLRWLEQLVSIEERPVLFVFAGKAHPADEPAQWMMREIQRISSQPPFIGKILLVEGYDMGISRLLTSGVDVWLNTPVHPFEASGTSGMKAAINGTVNLSVLDGWWAEAYDGGRKNGWGIPPSLDTQGDAATATARTRSTLYEILQDEVIPLYYARDAKLGYSPEWVALCKRSMASILPQFNSERVLHDYLHCFYAPAARRAARSRRAVFAIARELADWKAQSSRRVARRRAQAPCRRRVRTRRISTTRVPLEVDVALNGLAPRDVRVECVVHRAHVLGAHGAGAPLRREPARDGTGVTHIDDETVLLERSSRRRRPRASAATGSSFKPPWAGTLLYEIRALPAASAISRIRTSSARCAGYRLRMPTDDVEESFEISSGRPLPRPARRRPPDGVNFSVFSRRRDASVAAALSRARRTATPLLEVELDPREHRTFFCWHVFVARRAARAGTTRGAPTGRTTPADGPPLRPDARAARSVGAARERRAVGSRGRRGAASRTAFRARDRARRTTTTGKATSRSSAPAGHASSTRCTCGGFTRHPSSGVEHPGTFAGLDREDSVSAVARRHRRRAACP